MDIPTNHPPNTQPLVTTDPTAVILVTGFNALGLHTAFAIQRRLHWEGVPAIIMPIRVQL